MWMFVCYEVIKVGGMYISPSGAVVFFGVVKE